MLQLFLPGFLNDIHKPGKIALHVEMRIFQRIAHAGLRRQMHDQRELFMLENIGNSLQVSDVGMNKLEARSFFRISRRAGFRPSL